MTAPAALGGHTITTVRGPGTDNFGNPLPGSPAEAPIEGCFVQPRESTETTEQRDTIVTVADLFAPAGADLRGTDQVRWRGNLYQVTGVGLDLDDFDGQSHHIEATLTLIKG